jgi:hypothetical protein
MTIDTGNRSTCRKLARCHFILHKSHITCHGLEPGNPATNRLSYGTALTIPLVGSTHVPGL